MKTVIAWLARHAMALYLVSFVGAGGYLLRAIALHRQVEEAQFSLERDHWRRQERRAILVAGLFLLLGGLVFGIRYFLAEEVMVPEAGPEATVVVEKTSTPTATPVPPSPTAAPVVEVTAAATVAPTRAPTPAPPTPTPTLPPPPPPDCSSPDVQIVLPTAGSTVSGKVEVRGTVTINAFAYYKFEVIFPDGTGPNFIARFETPVENGLLGYWDVSDPTSYPDGGPYKFRLVAVDIYGNTTNCTVPVYISH